MLFIRLLIKYISFCLLCISFNAHSIVVGTYTAPPFSMNEDGEDIGLATEVIRDLLAKAGISDYSIVNYPLARGLVELKNGRIDIFYPYTPSVANGQNNFTLIGPISKNRVALFVVKDYQSEVSFAAMKNLVIGAERGGLGDLFLTKNSMRIELATQKLSCLKMVVAQRTAACAVGTLPGMYTAAINGLYDKLKYVETNEVGDMYLALGPSLPLEMVAAIKRTYTLLKKQNYFENKQKDYEKKFAVFIKSLA